MPQNGGPAISSGAQSDDADLTFGDPSYPFEDDYTAYGAVSQRPHDK